MAKSSFPSNVHVLKPRAMSLSDRLDAFLEKHALAPNDTPVRCDPTRPRAFGINAINCASCGQTEYLTRDYCRCGHYVRGQLEDEFLAWENRIAEDHEQLLETMTHRLRRLRYLNLLSMPFMVLPLIYLAFSSQGLSLSPMAWMAVGVAIMGACASVEKHLQKPIEDSQHLLNSYSLETYLEERIFLQSELDQ